MRGWLVAVGVAGGNCVLAKRRGRKEGHSAELARPLLTQQCRRVARATAAATAIELSVSLSVCLSLGVSLCLSLSLL